MEVLKRDVACPIGRLPVALSDMRYTLRNIGKHGRLTIDSLSVN